MNIQITAGGPPRAHSRPSAAPLPQADFTDVSHYDGVVDWDCYAAAGKQLAATKLTEGSNWSDSTASVNRTALHRLKVPCGLYHFAGSSSAHKIGAAETEAAHFLKQAGPLHAKEFPVLDFELTYGLSPKQQSEWIGRWCTIVAKETGKTPWLYTNGQIRPKLEAADLVKYPLWIADYRSSDRDHPPPCEPWPQLTAWQYSETAKIPGVGGKADGNFLYHNPLTQA